MQDSPLTNTGLGSALSMTGQVECDASIMDGHSGAFGGVGAVRGVRNPVLVALSIMDTERKRFLKLGRIPPMLAMLLLIFMCFYAEQYGCCVYISPY